MIPPYLSRHRHCEVHLTTYPVLPRLYRLLSHTRNSAIEYCVHSPPSYSTSLQTFTRGSPSLFHNSPHQFPPSRALLSLQQHRLQYHIISPSLVQKPRETNRKRTTPLLQTRHDFKLKGPLTAKPKTNIQYNKARRSYQLSSKHPN